jgi:hypothetical protein
MPYYPKAGGAFRGALVRKAADQTTLNATGAGVALTWDSETGGYDTDTIHDNSTEPTRLTVPTGVTRVRLSAQVYWLLTTADTFKLLQLEKNGSFAYVGSASSGTEIGASSGSGQIHSPVLTVTAGDYFEIRLFEESDTSITIESDNSWFAMEIIE